MQTFRYRAVSKDGKKLSGKIEAPDEFAAVTRLRETDFSVTKISKVTGKNQILKELTRGKISEKALSIFCSQFAVILSSGLPIVRAVELIASQTGDKGLKHILLQSAEDLAAGFGLAQSLSNRGKQLPITFIETIRSGEESGTLEVSFRRLQLYYEKSFQRKNKVKAAMVYPMFTLIVAVIVIGIIMVVAVPAFTSSFASMGAELPQITKTLIAVSNFLLDFWILLVIVIGGTIVGYRIYSRTEKGRLVHGRLYLKIPVLGKLNFMKVSAQLATTLSTLLAAGLPVMRAVTVSASVLDNPWMGSAIAKEIPGLAEGKTLASCLSSPKVLPDLLCEMVEIGEETGSLEDTLDMVSVYYDNETELASKKALSLLEPAIITILSLVVLVILLSVYLPMLSLYMNVG